MPLVPLLEPSVLSGGGALIGIHGDGQQQFFSSLVDEGKKNLLRRNTTDHFWLLSWLSTMSHLDASKNPPNISVVAIDCLSHGPFVLFVVCGLFWWCLWCLSFRCPKSWYDWCRILVLTLRRNFSKIQFLRTTRTPT